MPLTQEQFAISINTLFDRDQDWHKPERLSQSAAAFQNLSMHFIEKNARWLFDYVFFDPVKMGLMLKRYCRDAFGVRNYAKILDAAERSGGLKRATRLRLDRALSGLSIRINSDEPKRTRIAAAFSLWMSTMRPIYIQELPAQLDRRLWRLDATINFWITTSYLGKYGEIVIGTPEDLEDFDHRLRRIWYDLTFRDLNLSCLELLYASIFRPDRSLK